MERREQRVHFLLLSDVHSLDLAGPLQVFSEANAFGARYEVSCCAAEPEVSTSQGLRLAGLQPLAAVEPGDLVVVPGTESTHLGRLRVPVDWLRDAARAGARVSSICTGAFALARAGLLDNRQCTTHWRLVERLQREHPAARVLADRLFVRDGAILTSAGVAAGIDLALGEVEEAYGPLVTARVAREMVIYMRRNGDRSQQSAYVDFRTHLHPGVHRVQDWITLHPELNPTLEELAALAGMSPRHLTRRFRELTGISLKEYAHRVKLELAGTLLRDPALSVDGIAHRCGFADARQLRRLWRHAHGTTPAAWRRSTEPQRTLHDR